jgi:hypothetical protein
MMEPEKDLKTNQGIVEDVANSIGDGFIIGAVHFSKRFGHPTDNETSGAFIQAILAEFKPDDKIKYPFSNSFKDVWITVVSEITPVINELVNKGELENAKALGRTIAYGEVLRFLEANAQEAVDELKRISGETNKSAG